jgi:galactitol-specific phosphotransferase system IIC component
MENSYKRKANDFVPGNINPDLKYDLAYKRVKKIKGFYIHAMVYVLVNIFIIVTNYHENINMDSNFWRWEIFNTTIFWGIGLAFHGLSVFGKNIFFGHDWEERKINQFMEKEKNSKWE